MSVEQKLILHLVGSADPRTINEHTQLLRAGLLEEVPITIDAPIEINNEVKHTLVLFAYEVMMQIGLIHDSESSAWSRYESHHHFPERQVQNKSEDIYPENCSHRGGSIYPRGNRVREAAW